MAELRRNKNDSNDSFKLAMFGITQYDEIKFRGRKYPGNSYKNLKKYCLDYCIFKSVKQEQLIIYDH